MAKNKKKLEEAELRVVRFELNDVIVASSCPAVCTGCDNADCGINCPGNCLAFGA